MRKITLTILGLLFIMSASAQYLYPEHFLKDVPSFCLDCGNVKAEPHSDTWMRMNSALNSKALHQAKGDIVVQILVDSLGHAKLLSADNKTGVPSAKLRLEKAINNTLWEPAEPHQNVSVSFLFSFSGDGLFSGHRVSPFEHATNQEEPVNDGSDPKDLSYSFLLYNKHNGKLPKSVSDMSRGVAVDMKGSVWMGTDNGLVCSGKDTVQLFHHTNSPLDNASYDKNLTKTIFRLMADRDNGVWINQGWNLFRAKDGEWTRFDTLNSPVYWGRELFVDKKNNFWITSWNGICKYDGTSWTVFDSTNTSIPSNKVLSFYIDNQDRMWVGTFYGNAMYDGEKWIDLRAEKSPLGAKCIREAYQDASGNMWFAFYSDRNEHKGGLYMLDTKGKWHHYAPKWTKSMERECANDMLYDESRDQIWIAVNTVGLFMYDVRKDKWEVYTTENSKLPSPYVMQLCQDEDHHIWGATFGGFFMVAPLR